MPASLLREPADATASPGPLPPEMPVQQQLDRARMRTVAVVVVGLLIGAIASFGRTDAAGTLHPVLQSAALWMVAPFVLGALMRTWRGGVGSGLACALLQLGGYAGVCVARGLPPGDTALLTGLVVSAVGGPLFGGAGQVWRHGRAGIQGLGASAIASAFLADGGWRDLWHLGAVAAGLLWIAVGAVLTALLLRTRIRARWLGLTLPLAVAGEVVLTLLTH